MFSRLTMISGFFETFNSVLPLFDRKTFEKYYEQQYQGTPIGGPAWYASLNVVLALGGSLAFAHSQGGAMSSNGSTIQPEEALKSKSSSKGENVTDMLFWKYFRNACSCFVDLMFRDCNLMAVQAICGMVKLTSS